MTDLKKYDWDLEDLLEGGSLEGLYKEWKSKLEKLYNSYDNYIDTLESFKKYKRLEQEYSIISNKLSNYISNHANEDSVNEKWVSWNQRLMNDIQPFLIKTSNEENIIIKNKAKILNYLKDKDLIEYKRSYDLLFKNSKRILSKKEETLLAKLSKLDDGFENIYSSVVDSTTKFEDVLDSKGKKHKLNSVADVIKKLKSHDRTLRKNAWVEFNRQYYNNRYILTQTLYYNYLQLNEFSKIRKYQNYIDATCDEDEVNVKFVNLIYNGVQKLSSDYKKFYSVRDKVIQSTYNIDKVEPWDKSLDIIKNNSKYSIEGIQSILLEAFKIYGEEYVSIIKKAFDERWISWLPKPNKHSGAYSIGGTKGLKKYYISMNYDSTIQSLYTAAHELGHSLHSYYFNKHQKLYCSCSIFYAEIASITNEMILSFYLLDNLKSNKEKLFILDEIITGFFSTTTRQIIFSNFEYEMINKLENNLPITDKTIFETYNKMIEKYTLTKINKKYEKEPYKFSQSTILRIDHFYVGNFYVYKYAIGQICALIAASRIWNGDKNFLNKYFEFLKSGSSKSPIDTIKILGIDFSDEKVWNECELFIKKLINEYNSIYKSEIKKK